MAGSVLAAAISAAAALLNALLGSPVALTLLWTAIAGASIVNALLIRRGKSGPT